ncbi:MAG: hypothetical protein JJD93_09355 [Ilumatobacteraceae bacterium]|nr:hypothetical protein [Ilumatobacteraceae bacterium]
MDVFWLLLALGVCVCLLYLGYRIEPHHVNKDGSRFLCTGQWISEQGDLDGRRREVWVDVEQNGQLRVDVKRKLRHDVTHWWIEGKSPKPPRRRMVYALRTINILGGVERMTIQLPAKSRAVTVLDALMAEPR